MARVDAELLDERTAAPLLGVKSERTLQAWRQRGEGPRFVKLGKLVRYRRSDIETFIADGLRSSTRSAA